MVKTKFIAVALVIGLILGCAISWAAQQHMRAAMESLKTARMEVEKAFVDKGGHREKAIAFIDKAMEEVKKGMEFEERLNRL